MTIWNIITGEYPPRAGGVGDYTRMVAEGLADAGDAVCVWAPPLPVADETPSRNVRVNHLPDHFGRRGLKILAEELQQSRDARVLVEYVPHAFGMKAMNVPLCLMLLRQRRRDITVTFHEVAYPMSREQSIRHNLLGVINGVMAAILARAASRIFVAAEAWEKLLRRWAPASSDIRWLPVPSNIPDAHDRAATMRARSLYAPGGTLLFGHFGSYGHLVAKRLKPALNLILSSSAETRILLIGRNSKKFRDELVLEHPAFGPRLQATGLLSGREVSIHISACDLMVQPYPDGITARNTSALAGLAHRKPVVTTAGRFTENLWRESGAVLLALDGDTNALARGAIALARDVERMKAMSCNAAKLYSDKFDIAHTIAALRGN